MTKAAERAKKWADLFRKQAEICETSPAPDDIHPILWKAVAEGARSMAETLEEEASK